MGVPSFFRWLLEKYPRVVQYVKEEFIEYDDDGNRILPDASGKNPNDVEYDNLYLDMNGIIHPCCHPEDGAQPKSEEEMIMNVFKYIEHIFSMVRPRKLLYLAIDGVAPRAKMNQQRARRFRAAQEREEQIATRKKLESYYHKKGWDVPEAPPPSWDYNVITPGTPFMDKLAQSLRYWIANKLHHDAGWKGIKVILSDANIPGEGEHKIASFIRRCRNQKGHDPNTRHVLYGLDADLFMLGLATHELHFTILREEVLFGKNRPCSNCGIPGHFADRCQNDKKKDDPDEKAKLKPFIFANLSVMREYLEYELKIDDLEWWDLERVIDDFVFLCFFVGNDFLPHLPSLEIREGAIDKLLKYYKGFLPQFGGYLTSHGGKVNLKRANVLLSKLGDIEDEVFKNRTQSDAGYHRRNRNKADQKRKARIYKKQQKELGASTDWNAMRNAKSEINQIRLSECKLEDEYDEEQIEFLEFFDEYDLDCVDEHFLEKGFEHQLKAIHRVTQDSSKCKNSEKSEDLQFGTKGFKQRYYFKKMKIQYDENPPLLQQLVFEYVRGLCWVMMYYYTGCVSWSWYYPFHYSPFASDLKNIDKFEHKFNWEKIKSKPFTPFGQLMGVLPASSGKVALPKAFGKLMSDSNSPIIDFYPTDFKLDLNGKMYNWQAVVLLPFVDADRLVKTIKPLEDELNEDLKRMNGIGHELIYCNKSHSMARQLKTLYGNANYHSPKKALDAQLAQGMNGFVYAANGFDLVPINDSLRPPQAMKKHLAVIEHGVNVMSACYKMPNYTLHRSVLLDGVEELEPQLDETDFERMEKAPRFGKPRQQRRRDTHFNYNRGYDANIGYEGGKWKAKRNGNRGNEMHYQQTRKEYNDYHHFQKPHQYDNNNKEPAILSSFKKGGSGRKCVKKFPVFEPYPNECDPYKHRPSNAPYSVDPKVDYSQFGQNNGNNNSRRRGRGGRGRGRGRERGRGYRQYDSQRQQQAKQGMYDANGYPAHQQWYPQQGQYANYNVQQNAYYGQQQQYQQYQQPAYYQPQQSNKQYPSYNEYDRQQGYNRQQQKWKPKQSNQQNARKWG